MCSPLSKGNIAGAMPAEELQKRLPPRGMSNVVIDGYFMTESADDVFEKGQQASAATENAKRTLEKFYRSISSFPAVSLRSKS